MGSQLEVELVNC